jgi:hypothetical protein
LTVEHKDVADAEFLSDFHIEGIGDVIRKPEF